MLRDDEEIDVDDLPQKFRHSSGPTLDLPPIGPAGIDFNETVDQVETHMILQALEHTQWNKNRAAQLLGLNRTTLLEKIKKKSLRPPRTRPTSPDRGRLGSASCPRFWVKADVIPRETAL